MNNIIRIPCNISNYTKGRNKKIMYIVIHYTGNNGDKAVSNGNYFAQPNRNASAHYFVDEKEIVLSVREEDTAWHCGAKVYKHLLCRNNNSIGIEMCSKKDKYGRYYIDQSTQNLAIKLVKNLMKKYNIPLENVIRHYDVTGKLCPEPFVRVQNDWLEFKQKIIDDKKKEDDIMNKIYHTFNEIPDYAKDTIKKLMDRKILIGDEKGKIDLTNDMVRILVILDRSGIFK